MVDPNSPDLIGDIRNRGDRTTYPPPPGQAAKEGTLQGGSRDYPSLPPAGHSPTGLLLERRGDLSGSHPTLKPRDPYGGERGHDLKASWDWLAFAATLPADSLQVTGQSASFLLQSGRALFFGGSGTNTGTAGGTIDIRDGMDATGGLIDHFGVGATAGFRFTSPTNGLLVESGLYVVLSNVTITAAFWVVHLWKYKFTPPGE